MEFINRVGIALKGRDRLPPSVRKIMEDEADYGAWNIEICKKPLNQALLTLGNLLSKGKLEESYKRNNYDALFHLFCIITMENGKQFLLEKNHVIKLVPFDGIYGRDTLCEPVDLRGKFLTMKEIMDNTAKYMGKDFLPYDVVNNNCQDFITSVLTANKLNTPELFDWVNQDITAVIKDMNDNGVFRGLVQKMINWITMLDVLYHGGKKPSKRKRINQ